MGVRSQKSPSQGIDGCIPLIWNRYIQGDRLRSLLYAQIAALVKRVGASPRSVQVRELGYRWGSCGHKGDFYFHAPCGDAAAIDD
jgi:hypothetical protein